MSDKLVTIANFALGADPACQAELAKMKLNAEGIKCFLAGKYFVVMYWLYSLADHGIKLQVRQSDGERALEILGTNEKADIEESREDLTEESADLRCPKCRSEDIEYEKFSKKMFFLGILFFRFPLPFLKKSYKCNNCGHTWK